MRRESADVNVESFDADEEDGVRAPIPQRQDRMISPGYEGYALTRANPRLEMRMTSLLMTFVLTSCSESWSCITGLCYCLNFIYLPNGSILSNFQSSENSFCV